ncbi:unnamed protein product [Rhizoctonia solani]|uniref:Uncharacterized protein n=1 Tax=Rhizoctonia solani TaxID=456999 RepID=A0A8H3HC91_9AGAM|nr:unnamed protein product [Rhizoctonia solani]
MSSIDFNAIANAVFEELYDARGQPSELDEGFAEQYFQRLADYSGEPCTPEYHKSVLNLLRHSSSPLVDAVIPDEHLKFVAANIHSDWLIPGSCKIFGNIKPGAPYQFEVTSAFHFIRVSVYSPHSKWDRAEFLSHFPVNVPHQKGEGKWERN